MNLSVDVAVSILAQADELEIGLAVVPDGDINMETIRGMFYKALDKHPQFKKFMLCAMKDPDELWVIKRETEMPE